MVGVIPSRQPAVMRNEEARETMEAGVSSEVPMVGFALADPEHVSTGCRTADAGFWLFRN